MSYNPEECKSFRDIDSKRIEVTNSIDYASIDYASASIDRISVINLIDELEIYLEKYNDKNLFSL